MKVLLESSYAVSALHNPRQKKTHIILEFFQLKSFLCTSIRYIWKVTVIGFTIRSVENNKTFLSRFL